MQNCFQYLFSFCCLLSTHTIHAETTDPIFDKWRWIKFTISNGLPSNSVHNVVETKDRIWALTREGIAWFDDYQWHPVGPELGLPTGVAQNLTAMEDGSVLVIVRGQLYRGTESGFTHLPMIHDGTAIRIANAQPISPSRLILRSGENLYSYEDGIIQEFRSKTFGEMRYARKLIPTRNGLWLVTVTQLYRWEAGDWHPETQMFGEHGRIDWLVENQQGEYLAHIKAPTRALSLYAWTQTESRQPVKVFDQFCISADLGPNGEAIAVDSYHSIWLRQGKRWSRLPHVPEQFSQAKFLRYRDNGDLWLGTDQGLFLCRRSSERWTQIPSSPDGAPVEVNELLKGRDGSIWIATARGLSVHPYDEAANWFPTIDGQEQPSITALCEDTNGHIWVGSGAGAFKGAYRYDGNLWKPILCRPGTVTPSIHKIRRDSQGRLWFLALNQNFGKPSTETVPPGIYHLQDDYLVPWKPSIQLPSGRVYEFAESSDGAYWIGTLHSLSRWQNEEWTHWKTQPGNPIKAITIDSKTRVWFADFSSGLGYLKNDQLHFFTISDGLPNNRVMGLAVDQNDTLWMTIDGHGLVSYHDGVWSNHTGGMGSLYGWPVLPQGDHVLVGTAAGTHKMKIERSTQPGNRVNILPPSVVNRGVRLHWQVFPRWGEISPEDVETRYRLDQGDWSAWSSRHEVSLFPLAYGSHQLEVQAKDTQGYYANSTASRSFNIPTPFYRRAVFLIPIGALLVTVIVLRVVAQRRRHLYIQEIMQAETAIRKLNTELEQRVEDRTARLAAANEELQTFTYSVSHDLKAPLRGIDGYSRILMDECREKLDQDDLHCLQSIRSATLQMGQLIDDLLAYSRLEHSTTQVSTIGVRSLIEQLLNARAEDATDKPVNLAIDVPDDLTVSADREGLTLALRNLLENAYKFSRHSDEPAITIDTQVAAGKCVISVSDNGVGFDMKFHDRIFEIFQRLQRAEDYPGTGVGLAIVRKAMLRMNGRIWAQSAPGDGATFYLEVPL